MRDGAVISPHAEDSGPRLFEQNAQFGDHLLWRAGDDHQIFELFFELRSIARVLRPTGGKLDKGAAVFGAAVSRGRAPHGMGKTGELALHPPELGSVLERLLLGLGDVD